MDFLWEQLQWVEENCFHLVGRRWCWKIGCKSTILTGLKWEGQSKGKRSANQVQWYHCRAEKGMLCRLYCGMWAAKRPGGTERIWISCSEVPESRIWHEFLLLLLSKARCPCKSTNHWIKHSILSSFNLWVISLLPLIFISFKSQGHALSNKCKIFTFFSYFLDQSSMCRAVLETFCDRVIWESSTHIVRSL